MTSISKYINQLCSDLAPPFACRLSFSGEAGGYAKAVQAGRIQILPSFTWEPLTTRKLKS
jgi:hypothetical protein